MPPSTEELLGELLAALEPELADAVELRHELHAAPELAHEEHATAAAIAQGLPVAPEPVAGTGLLARVGGGDRAPVGVRAELDGLPLAERTGAPFSARGETMHACGHDVHLAALVALTRAAARLGDALPAPLLAIFQPSEEAYPSGAKLIAEEGLGDLAPAAVLAAHVHPELPWGAVALHEGTVNASFDALEVEMCGAPTHGAYPHHGRDPVLALCEAVLALQASVGRRVDPMHPASVSVGVLQAEGTHNVIPARALARGALRAHDEHDRRMLRELAVEVLEGVAAAHGCTARVSLTAGEPALRNDPALVAAALPLLALAGLMRAAEWRSLGSDDFAFFGAGAPLAMAFVGLDGAPGFVSRPLHHPELLPPDESVGVVARTQAAMFLAAATQAPHGEGVGMAAGERG